MTPTLNLDTTTITVQQSVMSPISTFMLDTSCRTNIVSILQRVPVFATIDPSLLVLIANEMDLLSVEQGTELVSANIQFTFILVVQGHINVLDETPYTLNPYDYFGLKNLFQGQFASSCSIVSDTDSVILTLHHPKFQSILQSSPQLALALLPILAEHTPDKLITAQQGNTPVSTAHTTTNQPPNDVQLQLQLPKSTKEIVIAIYDAKPYQVKEFLTQNQNLGYQFILNPIDQKLSMATVDLARGAHAVCVFVHDCMDKEVVSALKAMNIGLVLYRCAGYELCDVNACDLNQISVCRVPGYSPNAIAEHAVALMMALNRKLVWANQRVHLGDFSLDGLVGFDMKSKTVGVVGTGRIGACLVSILLGFGCQVLCYDVYKNPSLVGMENVQYVDLPTLYKESDIISLHAPPMDTTFHMIDHSAITQMKRGVMLINTSRGPLIDTQALINGLKSGHVGSCGLDVVEGEQEYFYKDCSHSVITNDQIAHLLSFQTKVIVTAHQAFLTNEALCEIASISLHNVVEYMEGKRMKQLSNSINHV